MRYAALRVPQPTAELSVPGRRTAQAPSHARRRIRHKVVAMTAVRIEALDPTNEQSQLAITTFLSEMVERVGADVSRGRYRPRSSRGCGQQLLPGGAR